MVTDADIEIVAVASPGALRSPVLRDRAERAWRPNSRQYVARLGSNEAGYLSFEDRADLRIGVVYEIFVVRESRGRGVGSSLLAYGEGLARAASYSGVRLCPRPLDDDIDRSRLVRWYERQGYVWCPRAHDEMEKGLDAPN